VILALLACAAPSPIAPPTEPVVVEAPRPEHLVTAPLTAPPARWTAEQWQALRADGVAPAGAPPLPAPWQAFVDGRVAFAQGDYAAAEARLASVRGAAIDREAAGWRARALHALGRTDEAVAVWEELTHAPDPAPGSAVALRSLADARPERASTIALRVWSAYPATPEDAALAPLVGPRPAVGAAIDRAAALADAAQWSAVVSLLDGYADDAAALPVGDGACRYHYVRGCALYKLGDRPKADAALAPTAEACANSPDLAVEALYLHAKLAAWRGQHRSAAARFTAVADRFPTHRYADDGLVLAGYHLDEAGDPAGAIDAWTRAISAFPDGDMIPEAELRAGRALWRAGQTDRALELLDALAARRPSEDRFSVPGGRYWAARIRWDDRPEGGGPEPTGDARAQAIDRWVALVEALPWTYYGLLAAMRLSEVAPDRLAALPRRPEPAAPGWQLRTAWLDDPAVSQARDLLAVGLVGPALDAWGEQAGAPTRDELLWWTESRDALGDGVAAHRDLRVWLRTNVPDAPSGDAVATLAVAYPDAWWPEIQAATAGDRYDPRLFQALVRTESNFDPTAVSWAGARGLSQVMPATGARVGQWSGQKVAADDLLDPATNLAIGSAYFDWQHSVLGGNSFLVAAAYNAGEGRVKGWWGVDGAEGSLGHLPTDEFVERIPFDETRMYVKRVLGTWQAYRWLDGQPLAPDGYARFNQRALPEPAGG
jgi:soluble lytic murein transglycosylase